MNVTKLNQIIAIEKGVRGGAGAVLTDAYQRIQRTQPIDGISRSYRPKDDDGELLPSELKRVQYTVDDVIGDVTRALTRMFDVTFTRDFANTQAVADVVVDDRVLVKGAPATYLLWLEKALVDLRTLVTKLPTLDPADRWTWDSNANAFASEPVETTRTKKVPRNHVLAPATDRHPAQVQVYQEDVVVGYWKTIKFSGAIPAQVAAQMLERVEKLQRAVKFARERANSIDVTDKHAGLAVLSYVFVGEA